MGEGEVIWDMGSSLTSCRKETQNWVGGHEGMEAGKGGGSCLAGQKGILIKETTGRDRSMPSDGTGLSVARS